MRHGSGRTNLVEFMLEAGFEILDWLLELFCAVI